MSAALENVVPFELPKKPKVKEKDPLPDQRKVAVLPFRAVFDKELTHGALQALAALCAYCNRAGITWVSQARLASDLGITQQAIAKQFKQLRDRGYLQIVRAPYRGQRTSVLRVVYDPDITAEDAITMTSNKEDTRPPAMREEQEREAAQQIDRAGLKRIAQLVAGISKQPAKPKEPKMAEAGQSPAVKKMKDEIAKAKAKRTKPVDKSVEEAGEHNSQVVTQGEKEHNQKDREHNLEVVSVHNPEVVHNTDIEHSKVIYKVNRYKQLQRFNLSFEDCKRVCGQLSEVEAIEHAELLLPIFQAEGLKPSSHVLADAILQLHKDSAKIKAAP